MKTIKIPRIVDGYTHPVKIIKSESTDKKLTLRRQTIQTVAIPKGSVIHLDRYDYSITNHFGDIAEVPIEYINKLIRYLYLETLRNQL